MLIRVDPSSPTPLGDQVAASVRRAVAEGQVSAGDRWPPAREVASSLGINLHTVLRGYQQL
ncbi:MAG: GntR family transcriptional regulator, partial [Pseudonocardia sediminis]